MGKPFKLLRTVQCAKCPFLQTTNPFEIPDGYKVEKHEALRDTIATDLSFDLSVPLKVMACHHSKDTQENAEYCVGWLHNQLGRGNNIPLRLKMRSCENLHELKIIGEQHLTFEDTLPKNKK